MRAFLYLALIGQAPAWEVHFAPGPGPEAQVCRVYVAAKHWLRVECYSFTSGPIADALIAAHKRGIDCALIIDGRRVDEPGGQARRCAAAGVAVLADRSHPIFHDKVSVADGAIVVTGSWNYSHQAGRNGENLLTARSARVAAAYTADWKRHAAHAERLTAGGWKRVLAPLPEEEP